MFEKYLENSESYERVNNEWNDLHLCLIMSLPSCFHVIQAHFSPSDESLDNSPFSPTGSEPSLVTDTTNNNHGHVRRMKSEGDNLAGRSKHKVKVSTDFGKRRSLSLQEKVRGWRIL